jgi:hypothetical protein
LSEPRYTVSTISGYRVLAGGRRGRQEVDAYVHDTRYRDVVATFRKEVRGSVKTASEYVRRQAQAVADALNRMETDGE